MRFSPVSRGDGVLVSDLRYFVRSRRTLWQVMTRLGYVNRPRQPGSPNSRLALTLDEASEILRAYYAELGRQSLARSEDEFLHYLEQAVRNDGGTPESYRQPSKPQPNRCSDETDSTRPASQSRKEEVPNQDAVASPPRSSRRRT
jgi:BioD-like phosphotransacetylase family protein